MKRLILIIIGVLLCTSLYADMNTYIAGSGTVAAAGGGSITRYPTGNGLTTWLIGGSDPASTNWESVDEESADDGVTYNYRESYAATDRFTYSSPNVPAGATNISITVYVRQKRSSAGACYARSTLRVNDILYYGAGHSDPGETWGTQSATWTANPNTTEAWTVADVNGTGDAPLSQFGYSATGIAVGEEIDVTQVYMVITYD